MKHRDPILPRFKVLVYKKDTDYIIDRYTGYSDYTGQAVTYRSGSPVFALNYYGRIINHSIPARDIFRFLKAALRAERKHGAHRGLNGFHNHRLTYLNRHSVKKGILVGRESILLGRKIIYCGTYHGGRIVDNRPDSSWLKNIAQTQLPMSVTRELPVRKSAF